MARLDSTELIQIKTDFETEFGALFSNYNIISGYYNQTMDLGAMPPDIEIYKPPSAREAVNDAVNHIMGLGQKCTVPPWNNTQKVKDLCSKLTSFGDHFLMNLDRTFKGCRRNAVKSGILYGMFAIKMLYLPRLKSASDGEKEWEDTLNSTFPFTFRDIHPQNIMFDSLDKYTMVIEKFKRKAIHVKNVHPEWDMGDKKPFEEVDWWEFWSDEQMAYFVGDEQIENKENIYGFIPYEFGCGGFGGESETGKMEDMIVSMLASALSSYKYEARVTTAVLAGAEYGVYGKPTVDRPLQEGEVIASTPGELSVVGRDANYRNIETPRVTEDAWRMLGIVKEDQEKVLPSVLSGNVPRGTTSGYMHGISEGQARMGFDALKSDIESAMGNLLDKVIRIIRLPICNEPIGILGNLPKDNQMTTLKPTELNSKLIKFIVRYEGETPEQQEQRFRLMAELWAMGFIDKETAYEQTGKFDYQIIKKRQLIEKALSHPAILQELTRLAMQDAGMSELIAMIQAGAFNQPKQGAAPLHGFGTEQKSKMMLGEGTQEMMSPAEMGRA